MRIITLVLAALLLLIQYPLWLGKGGWLAVADMENQVDTSRAKTEQLKADVCIVAVGIEGNVEDLGLEGLGVKVDRCIALVFLLAGALAGVGGVLYGMKYNVFPQMGNVGLKAFIASVIGGLGSVPGAIVGAIVLGILETMVSGYISSSLRDLFSFTLLIVLLLVKPSGLFGVDVQDKA